MLPSQIFILCSLKLLTVRAGSQLRFFVPAIHQPNTITEAYLAYWDCFPGREKGNWNWVYSHKDRSFLLPGNAIQGEEREVDFHLFDRCWTSMCQLLPYYLPFLKLFRNLPFTRRYLPSASYNCSLWDEIHSPSRVGKGEWSVRGLGEKLLP